LSLCIELKCPNIIEADGKKNKGVKGGGKFLAVLSWKLGWGGVRLKLSPW
jgi:hypothetical protein